MTRSYVRDGVDVRAARGTAAAFAPGDVHPAGGQPTCLLYTSDAADEL